MGERDAAWLSERVRGIDAAEVVERDVAKSISRDETFDMDLHDDLLLEGELAELVGRAAADLRGDDLSARTVTVRIRDADFTTRQASRTLRRGLESRSKHRGRIRWHTRNPLRSPDPFHADTT